MKFGPSWFLARRYLTGMSSNNRINTVSIVCFLSIFVGTVALTLQLFVSQGFEKVLTEKMQSIYPQLVLEAPQGHSFDYPTMQIIFQEKFKTRIIHTAPAHSKRVVIKPLTSNTPSAVVLKAVDPLLESSVSAIATKLENQVNLSDALNDKKIIIGKKLAEFYDLSVGDRCSLLYTADDELTEHDNFESTEVTIGALMETGIVQYDKYSIICSLNFMKTVLQEDALTLIGCTLQDGVNEAKITQELEQQFKCEVNSWKTLYPALVAATKLEKYVMSLLLGLMALLALTNVIALLFMQITQKKRDIALLQTLGMKQYQIVALFIFMGLLLVGSANVCGIIVALSIGFILQKYPFIQLPDAYFCSHLPVHITWQSTLFVFCIILLLGLLATWFSARSVKSMSITQTLRFEG